MAKLNEKQYAAIALLSLPDKGGMTYEQIAKEVGVSRRQLQEWRKDDSFNDELKREVMRGTLDRFPEVMASIPDHIIKDGNAAMFRTLLQSYGLLTEKVEVTSDSKSGDIDAIKAEIERLRGK